MHLDFNERCAWAQDVQSDAKLHRLSGRIYLYPVYFNLQSITIKGNPHARKSIHIRSHKEQIISAIAAVASLSLALWIPLFLIIISLFFHFSLQLASSSSHIAYFRNMYSSSSFNSLVRSFVHSFFPFCSISITIYLSIAHTFTLAIYLSFNRIQCALFLI